MKNILVKTNTEQGGAYMNNDGGVRYTEAFLVNASFAVLR